MNETRTNRLRQLINERFNGKQVDFSEKTKISTSQIGQWIGGYRSMGEKSARRIEQLCRLPTGWLDDAPYAAQSSPEWPFIGISDSEWESASERVKGVIEGYARSLIDQELRRSQESQQENSKRAA